MEDGPSDDTDTVIVVVWCCLRHLMRGRRDCIRASRWTWRQRKEKKGLVEESHIVSLAHSLSLSLPRRFRASFSLDLSLSTRAAIKCFCSRRNPILDAHLNNVG